MVYVFIFLIFLTSCTPNNFQKVIDYDETGLYHVKLTDYSNSGHGETIFIKNDTESFELDISKAKPFKVEFCNIDGGDVELLVGVEKTTPFDENTAIRPFFYNIDFKNKRLKPKMRVSRLSNPVLDFTTFDIDDDGYDELVSVERDIDGKYDINAYKYINTFTFQKFYKSKKLDEMPKIINRDGEILLDGSYNLIYLDGGNILWEEILK